MLTKDKLDAEYNLTARNTSMFIFAEIFLAGAFTGFRGTSCDAGCFRSKQRELRVM